MANWKGWKSFFENITNQIFWQASFDAGWNTRCNIEIDHFELGGGENCFFVFQNYCAANASVLEQMFFQVLAKELDNIPATARAQLLASYGLDDLALTENIITDLNNTCRANSLAFNDVYIKQLKINCSAPPTENSPPVIHIINGGSSRVNCYFNKLSELGNLYDRRLRNIPVFIAPSEKLFEWNIKTYPVYFQVLVPLVIGLIGLLTIVWLFISHLKSRIEQRCTVVYDPDSTVGMFKLMGLHHIAKKIKYYKNDLYIDMCKKKLFPEP